MKLQPWDISKRLTIKSGYDEETGKYYLIDPETNERTEPFADEVFLSEVPLGTWVDNYAVVRIGLRYYIADGKGNRYREEFTPFIICRNVFVQGDGKYIVPKNLHPHNLGFKIHVIKSKKYKYAVGEFKHGSNIGCFLIDADANVTDVVFDKAGIIAVDEMCILNGMSIDFASKTSPRLGRSFSDYNDVLLNDDFKVVYAGNIYFKANKIKGKRSRTYYVNTAKGDEYLYSAYFDFDVSAIYNFGEYEVVRCDGKTYVFKPDGEVECLGKTSELLIIDRVVIYSSDMEMIVRDNYSFEVVARQTLSPTQVYEAQKAAEITKKEQKNVCSRLGVYINTYYCKVNENGQVEVKQFDKDSWYGKVPERIYYCCIPPK